MSVHPYIRLFPDMPDAPTINDDESLGYEQGDVWFHIGGNIYFCQDPTDGAAVWTTGGGDGLTLNEIIQGLLVIGDEEVVNGEFTTDASGWTLGAGWAWSSGGGGSLLHTAGNTASATQTGSLLESAIYVCSINLSGTAGTVLLKIGNTSVVTADADAGVTVQKIYIEAGQPKVTLTPSSDFDGAVLNVSVKRVPFVEDTRTGDLVGRQEGEWVTLGDAALRNVGTGSGDVAAGNKGVTNGDSHDHSGGDGGTIAYGSLSGAPTIPGQEEIEDYVGGMVSGNTETGIAVTYDDTGGKLNFDAQTAGDARYAPIAKGVTNGDSHDHSGGDGGTIAYSSLSGTPTEGGGTYTPVLTNVQNITSSSVPNPFMWLRQNNTVMVAGRIVAAHDGSGDGHIRISLPVASNFANNDNVQGNATNPAAARASSVIGDATNDEVILVIDQNVGTGTLGWRIVFMYEVIP